MTLVYAVLILVTLLVAFRFTQPVYAWTKLMRLELAARRTQITDPASLPPLLEPLFREARRQMESLGFTFTHAQWTAPLSASEPARPTHVYVHEDTGTYAAVVPPVFENGQRLFGVVFTTRLESGRVVVTIDGLRHMTPLPLPGVELHDHYVNNVPLQWREHQRSLGAETPVRITADRFVLEENERLRRCVEAAAAQGTLLEVGVGRWRIHPLAAWHAAHAMIAGAQLVVTRGKERVGNAGEAPPATTPAWVAAGAWAFHAGRRTQASLGSPRNKLLAFGLSAAAFAIGFGLLLSWRMVPALFAVVLLHELGHLAGMRLFGYRERRILMLPFFGGAAIGRKEDASAFERTVVYLLGPVPGLALGLLLLATQNPASWLHELGLLAVVVNYLNLLPIMPLDGGRVIEVLFLERHPRAAGAFLVVSVATLGLGGLLLGDTIVLTFALLLGLALPHHWRAARVATEVRRHFGPGRRASDAATGETAQLRATFEVLGRAEYQKLRPPARHQLARGVLAQLAAPPAARKLALSAGALYALLLVAPVAGGAALLTGIAGNPISSHCLAIAAGEYDAATAPELRDAIAEVCATPDYATLEPAERWATLMRHAESAAFRGDRAALPYFQLAAEEAREAFGRFDARYRETKSSWDKALGEIAEEGGADVKGTVPGRAGTKPR